MSEWRMVINPHGMGYSEGLDPRRELEFKRVGDPVYPLDPRWPVCYKGA
jgi:hypothetical protein